MNRDQDERWHLDKRVPIAMILTLLAYGIAGLWFVADIKKDVEVLKDARQAQVARDQRQDEDMASAVRLVREDIKELGQKLDRALERSRR